MRRLGYSHCSRLSPSSRASDTSVRGLLLAWQEGENVTLAMLQATDQERQSEPKPRIFDADGPDYAPTTVTLAVFGQSSVENFPNAAHLYWENRVVKLSLPDRRTGRLMVRVHQGALW
jgi:hypothetical protein